MNSKKMMVLALLLTLGTGMAFAENLTRAVKKGAFAAAAAARAQRVNTCSDLENVYQIPDCEQYLKTLQSNEYLEFFLPSGGYHGYYEIKDYKTLLTEAAEKSVGKYENYSAYRNAAIVYVAEDFETSRSSDPTLSKNSATKAKEYATKAINRAEAQSVPAPEMYFVRALADIRYYRLIDYGMISLAQKHALEHKDILERNVLPDLEKVGKVSPYHTPWGWMEFMYEALGHKEDAERCHEMENKYRGVGVH